MARPDKPALFTSPKRIFLGERLPGAINIPWAQAANEDFRVHFDQPNLGIVKLLPPVVEELLGKSGISNDTTIPVCPEIPAGLQGREELRRLVDGVGQPDRCADREGSCRSLNRNLSGLGGRHEEREEVPADHLSLTRASSSTH
jgi:hypothetical protein